MPEPEVESAEECRQHVGPLSRAQPHGGKDRVKAAQDVARLLRIHKAGVVPARLVRDRVPLLRIDRCHILLRHRNLRRAHRRFQRRRDRHELDAPLFEIHARLHEDVVPHG